MMILYQNPAAMLVRCRCFPDFVGKSDSATQILALRSLHRIANPVYLHISKSCNLVSLAVP